MVLLHAVQASAVMDSDTKKLIRAVVRRVHPDLFTAHQFERQRNSDSLKVGQHNQGLCRGDSRGSTHLGTSISGPVHSCHAAVAVAAGVVLACWGC